MRSLRKSIREVLEIPKELQGRFFYQPSKSGYQLKIGPIIDRQRETIMASSTDDQSFGLTEEILTNAGTKLQAEIDHWIGRANSDNSNRLSEQRDRVISSAKLKLKISTSFRLRWHSIILASVLYILSKYGFQYLPYKVLLNQLPNVPA